MICSLSTVVALVALKAGALVATRARKATAKTDFFKRLAFIFHPPDIFFAISGV
jgi:hypothetical protein